MITNAHANKQTLMFVNYSPKAGDRDLLCRKESILMHDFFGFSMLAALIAVLVSIALLVHAFFSKKTYRPRLIFSGIAFALLVLSFIGFVATRSPEERAAVDQQRIAKQAQEAQEKAEKEEKKAQEAAEKKQKEEQAAKAKEQAAADAAAQKVYDDQAKYEAWIPEQIKLLCRQSLKENFISVDINDDLGKMDDSKIVLVHCQANMNVFSDEQLRRALMIQSSKVMETLYKANLPISEVTIFANGSLIDQYGNKFNDTIMKCTLSSDTAKKINWKHVHDLVMSFQDMQDELWYHPAIRK